VASCLGAARPPVLPAWGRQAPWPSRVSWLWVWEGPVGGLSAHVCAHT